MKKTYKCTNVKFCMDDEVQRQAWEYLHGLNRKQGSYGKILAEALVKTFSDIEAEGSLVCNGTPADAEKSELLTHEILEKINSEIECVLEEIIERVVRKCFTEYAMTFPDSGSSSSVSEEEQKQGEEMSDDMMSFAFAMGE